MTLNTMSARERRTWGYQVQHKLWFLHGVEYHNLWTVLAGKTYREGLYWLGPPATVYAPLSRVGGIGKQIAWLQHQLGAVTPKKRVPCEVYSRVVGYVRPVEHWPAGKQQEFVDRQTYEVETAKWDGTH
ncbi:MAG: hypothetical protein GWN58_27820 [Anaerolineae bacterium]|nr:hypothetical protein [Anaerolineae bacterium]